MCSSDLGGPPQPTPAPAPGPPASGPPGPPPAPKLGNGSDPAGSDRTPTGRPGANEATGPARVTTGPGQFVGLPKRDRAALQQSQGEKYPAEYGPMVEQYLRNLSDPAGAK